MSVSELTRLFPTPARPFPHTRCYLDQPLRPHGWEGLFLYANFVVSLDGRISVVDPHSGRESVPKDIANPRDWRLFQELAAHAGTVITSGRYLREFAAGNAQDVLPIGDGEAFADIRAWRQEHGMRAQPDVAVLSAGLDFIVPSLFREQGRRVLILTTETASQARADRRRAEGAEVIRLGDADRLAGDTVADTLADLGYSTAYCIAGPYVLNTLLVADRLDCLFLTTVHRMIGARRYATINAGDILTPPADFRLTSLFFDPAGAHGAGQHLARYDRARAPARRP